MKSTTCSVAQRPDSFTSFLTKLQGEVIYVSVEISAKLPMEVFHEKTRLLEGLLLSSMYCFCYNGTRATEGLETIS